MESRETKSFFLNICGRWCLVRLTRCRRAGNVMKALVMTVIDIDRTKETEEKLRAAPPSSAPPSSAPPSSAPPGAAPPS